MKYYFIKIKDTYNCKRYSPLIWEEVLILIKAGLIQQQNDTYSNRKKWQNIKTHFLEEYKWLIACKYMFTHTSKLRVLTKMITLLPIKLIPIKIIPGIWNRK